MKKNIAVISGGDSDEYVISVQTAQHLMNNINKDLYNTYLISLRLNDWHVVYKDAKYPIDKNDFSVRIDNTKIKFDFAYFAIHGTPAENGKLQGYFDMLDIPYSTCGVLASSLTFNKYFCNQYLNAHNIRIAKSVLLRKEDEYSNEHILREVGLPCFVKPNADGSSFGISKVKEETELTQAIENAFKQGDEVIIEEYIEGIEVTCGLVKLAGKPLILPLTEIVSKNEFFDYEAKYDPTLADEITPARVSQNLTDRIQLESLKIYNLLNCKGIVRVDYILKDDDIYLLEINTIPGMSPNSIIPKQVKEAGLIFSELITNVIQNEMK